MEIYVDLKDLIDVKAELAKNEQQEQKLLGLIKAKEAKLANESFVSRARPMSCRPSGTAWLSSKSSSRACGRRRGTEEMNRRWHEFNK